MHKMLLSAAALGAAIALPEAPGHAQAAIGIGVPSAKPSVLGTPPSVDLSFGEFRGGRHRDGDRDRRRQRGDDALFVGGWYSDRGEWQGDTAWRATGYNDWWHERPQRAYPRWMQRNEGCERMWWSGGGWRC